KPSLPNRFVYIAGADVAIAKRLTGAFDVYGQRVFSGLQLFPTTFTDAGRCNNIACTSLTPGSMHPATAAHTNTNYNITNASIGLKFRPFRRLVVTGNVLLNMDDGGLRSKAIPLIGASYSF